MNITYLKITFHHFQESNYLVWKGGEVWVVAWSDVAGSHTDRWLS